ncbi:MAG: restriction endonuclease subunit S [Gemmatimonadaceae bacterium]
MNEKLRPYPAYRDSGIPWLGKIPEHWGVRRLKYILRERDARSVHGTEQLLRVSQYTGVTQRTRADGLDEPDTRAESLVGYRCVQPDDLVVNIMLAWNGSMGVSRFSGIASPAYCVYRFGASAEPWYFHHLLRSPVYKARIKSVSTGVVESRLRLYTDDLNRLDALSPSACEQAAIVRFLDHADGRIGRYIHAKQKLIKLLEEQKQAIIHRAVARGLDCNVRLKSSGVEWIGDVPEHWEVRALGRCITLQRGFDITKQQQIEGQIPVISSGGISSFHDRASSRGPGVVVGRKGSVGIVHYVQSDYWAHDTTLWVREFNGNVPRFIYYLLVDMDLKRFDTGSANPTINRNILHPEPVAWAPIEEQTRIASFLDRQLQQSDRVIRGVLVSIARLSEYRTRLVADVVTGKLDVREAAARLPALIEEPASLDDLESITDSDADAEGADLDIALAEAET